MRVFRIFLFALCLTLPQKSVAGNEEVLVFAAASLTDVVSELADAFDGDVTVSFGASSLLARQVVAGAPADIFISANRAWASRLVSEGVGDAAIIVARNRLAVLGRVDLPALDSLEALNDQVSLAIADPAHVPAGIYARQALEAAGVWASLSPNLRRTANVRLASALAAIGAVDYAIAYVSDAHGDDRLEVKYLIAADGHEPIAYFALAVSDRGLGFLDFLLGDEAGEIFSAHGFAAP